MPRQKKRPARRTKKPAADPLAQESEPDLSHVLRTSSCCEDRHEECGSSGASEPMKCCGCPCHGQYGPMCAVCWKERDIGSPVPKSIRQTKESDCRFCPGRKKRGEWVARIKRLLARPQAKRRLNIAADAVVPLLASEFKLADGEARAVAYMLLDALIQPDILQVLNQID